MDISETLDVLQILGENFRKFINDVRKLQEVEQWALAQLPVQDGDAVTLKRDIQCMGGWYPYREVLVEGCTGTISNIYLYKGEWRCYFQPDVCWSVAPWADGLRRYESGQKNFMLNVEHMRKRKKHDTELIVPADAKPRMPSAAKV